MRRSERYQEEPTPVVVVDCSNQLAEILTSQFESYLQAKNALSEVCKRLGFKIYQQYRNGTVSNVSSAGLYCDRGRVAVDGTNTTHRNLCPFVVRVRRNKVTLKYSFEGENLTHNHYPIAAESGGLLELNEAVKREIRSMYISNASSAAIQESIARRGVRLSIRYSPHFILFRHISTVVSPIGAIADEAGECSGFFSELEARGFFYEFSEPNLHTTTQATVNSVFFSKDSAMDMFQRFPEVIIFDTTYKTSISRLPLGIFVGVDSNMKSFCIGFVILSCERTEAFQFAIEVLMRKARVGNDAVKTVEI